MYLTQSVHRAAQQGSDTPITVFGDRVRTGTESAERISRLAGALRALGVGTGDRVAMLALNSDRYHEYLMATWWIGAAVVPVNIRWAPAEILYALRDSGTRVLLVDDTFAPMVPALRETLDTVVSCGEGPVPHGMLDYEQLITDALPVEDLRLGGDTLAGIFYTGGTTGFPKGVMLSHTNLLVSAMGGQAYAGLVTPGGRMLHAAPMFHVADLAAWTIQNLLGGTHVFIPAFEPAAVLKAIEIHQITSMLLVPIMIQILADHPKLTEHDVSSCQGILYGASSISEAVLKRAMDAFPTAGFVQSYGMTEVAPIATLLTAQDHVEGRLRSGGRPASHSEIRVVDPDGANVPPGTIGEVLVRGSHVMLGYWDKPVETADALRDGWYHTGDGAYLDEEGYLYVVDRLKDMIVSGGENVYSAEVENAIAQHPSVANCAVIGVPDQRFGERVHAIVSLKPGCDATAEEIRGHTKALIAGYKSPQTIEFADSLPLSGAGKVLKRELRAQFSGPSDDARG